MTRRLLNATAVGVVAGTASALLLALLDWATTVREANLWLITLLPLAGFVTGWLALRFGDAKVVFPGTVVSHLFGASAGREGTAVKVSASLADQLSDWLELTAEDRCDLLNAARSAGFASVFGTPMAGALYGLEAGFRLTALLPCFLAAFTGHFVTLAWGIHHTVYSVGPVSALSVPGLLAASVAGIAFGATGGAFRESVRLISSQMARWFDYAPMRPIAGGVVVAVAVWLLGTTRYVGLGIPVIVESFAHPLHPWDFAGRFAFTIVTLGTGFQGGEVTPLFFIGATLGNSLGAVLPLPFPLLAGMGFAAVFGAAARRPLASAVMAMEIFGPGVWLYSGIACAVSWLVQKRVPGPRSH